MYFLSYFVLISLKKVKIVYENDMNLHLAIASNGKSVRLISKEEINKGNANDTFDTTGTETRLKQNKVFLCGKLSDPGLITCENQKSKIVFKFKNHKTGVNIETDNNLCITKKGFDSNTNGYYLHLAKCNMLQSQSFRIFEMLDSEDSKSKENKNNPESLTDYDYEVYKNLHHGQNYHENITNNKHSYGISSHQIMKIINNVQRQLDDLQERLGNNEG